MRHVLTALLLLVPGLAVAQAPTLGTVTCASVTVPDAPNPARLLAAMQGLLAARAGRPLLSEPSLDTMREALAAGCAGQPQRRLVEVLATARAEDPQPYDFVAMTCTQLARLWRPKAPIIVPFLAAYLGGEAVGPEQMDALASRLQSTCRLAENAERLVLEVARTP